MAEDATGTPPFPFFGRTAAPLDGLSALAGRLRCCRAASPARSDLIAAVTPTRARIGSAAAVGFAGLDGGAGAGGGDSAAGVVLRPFASALLAARDDAPRRRAAARSLPLGGGSDPVTAAYPL